MRQILKEKGYRATPARLAILKIFTENGLPLTAEKIYKELKRNKKNQDINEATVYRSLATLEDGGIIRRIDFRKDALFFELAREHHHHITCLKCDAVEDFKSDIVERALRRIILGSSKFINIKEHSLELFGVCKKCAF